MKNVAINIRKILFKNKNIKLLGEKHLTFADNVYQDNWFQSRIYRIYYIVYNKVRSVHYDAVLPYAVSFHHNMLH